ncbi:MAG: Signal transduction histidine kinase [Myxococcales bacterium]|nr:Signal transduction histidine kinase [Myxococcales bacterium]
MKIRTKLILLLSAALIVTMIVSTWVRLRWTERRLEDQLRQSAQDTAVAIADELVKSLRIDTDQDEMSELLKEAERRHPGAINLKLTLSPDDEETITTFELGAGMANAKVATKSVPIRPKTTAQRREEARRAYYDHGESLRPPGQRFVEPLWRTPDKPSVADRWPARTVQPATQKPVVQVQTHHEGGVRTIVEARAPVDPLGPMRGEISVSKSDEPIVELVRAEELASVLITGSAVLMLMLMTAFIVNRVVGRPVSTLEAAMKRVEGGALEERVPEATRDEVGALSRGFNAMLTRLAEADGEIRAFNRRLADEVKAATLDLARKNEALAQLNRLLRETRQELGDKERLAALGQLAAQLAHEIGTPLGSVSGHLQLAISARDVPAPLKDRLQVATTELERVSKIVRDYLDSTRTVAPERVAVDVERIVDEALGICIGAEVRTRIDVQKTIEPGAAHAETDPGLLRQILVNLVTNAVDALSAEGGHIRVEARVDRGAVAIAVADDGVGIAAEDAARIFEPFYTTKGRGKGTGLGLAICRELATALGGRITVESAPGRGSTFTVTLPRSERKAA